MGDYPLWLYISKNSKVYFFNKITGVYRVLNESASHSKNVSKSVEFIRSSYELRTYFANLYNIPFNKEFNENESYISCAFNKCYRKEICCLCLIFNFVT